MLQVECDNKLNTVSQWGVGYSSSSSHTISHWVSGGNSKSAEAAAAQHSLSLAGRSAAAATTLQEQLQAHDHPFEVKGWPGKDPGGG
jgi:hypothetical protein